ncbi:GntR family transcriptional regulator [Clostridium uliginosum]|uniref:DNA-binding transcriptional regulator, GntR family n=1 Tax=Clostridium uliginosum TaxID=119641 RepID=A0A1I1MTC0_9CLOT|nr:GntR family transcriptional regulator [Clostridium uliginosum]SFC88385.1 DNA-binding transcriptional regulator, GntR family [Clostridium uliginosum]
MDYISSNNQPISVEQVYRDIRKKILKLQLEPGQKISENQMCEEYGVSRSIIRNVFIRLNQLELLTIYPQRGTYVSLIDLNYIEDLLILRTAVEKEVLYEMFTKIKESKRLVLVEELENNLELQEHCRSMQLYGKEFQKLDSAFHKIMIDSVKRYRLVKILENPMLHIARWRNFDVAFDNRLPELIDEHRAIENAIKENNLIKAQHAMETHLETISQIAGRAKEKYPQYFTK